jgi:type IV secretory pathway TraG/TraD family ATPase VirD4
LRPPPRHGPTARWRDYLGLAVFLGLLTIPFPLAAGIAASLVAGRIGLAVRRRARTRRSETALGASPGVSIALGHERAGRPVTLSDEQLAAHALIVGASGSGKSTTLLTILSDHIAQGRPVVALDMKGSPAFARELGRAAAAAGRGLRVWTPDGPSHWNPLAHGNATALKDMLISTERFSEPHYQRAAERYLQTVFSVLHAAHPERPAQLDEVVSVMEPRRLAAYLRQVPPALAERVSDYLGGLTSDQESAVRGLGTRLAVLSESTAGPYLDGGAGPAFDLRAGLEGGDVLLVSINSSVYGTLGAQLGALAIQGLTSAAGYRLQNGEGPTGGYAPPLPATVAIDEFSALGADNVLALLARGREAGVTTLIATQELNDLERAARGFRDQVMGIVGLTLAHRQEVHTSATMISQLAGTEWAWVETENMRGPFARRGLSQGTRRLEEQPVVHPNEIKALTAGEVVMFTKLPTTKVARLTVDRRAPRVSRGSIGRQPPGDQAAPGVTR